MIHDNFSVFRFGSFFGRHKKDNQRTPQNLTKEKKTKQKSRKSRGNEGTIDGLHQNQDDTNVNPIDHNSDQFKYENLNKPRTSVFQPRATLVEPSDQFPYKLGRESVPRRSTLYHGVDFDKAKYLADDQIRKSIQKPIESHERPSTSRNDRYSYPPRESGEMFKEERVDFGKRNINDGYNIYEYNTEERLSFSDPNRKTVVRFRPHSVAHSKPSELSKMMVFRADQMEHKLVLGKNVRSIPLQHRRHVPILLADDRTILQPLPESVARKSSLKPDKNAETLEVSLTEIENVGGIPRKSIIFLDSNGVEDNMPSLRKSTVQDKNRRQSIRKSIAPDEKVILSMRKSTNGDGNVRQSTRKSIVPYENVTRKSFVEDENVRRSLRKSILDGNLRKSTVADPNLRQSIRNSYVQEGRRRSISPREEKRYSVIQIINDDDERNNQRQSFSHTGTDSHQYKVPVIPARHTTSKTVQRYSLSPTRCDLYDSKAVRNSVGPKPMSVISNSPDRKRHSIIVMNVESPTSPFLSKNRHPSSSCVDDSRRVEPFLSGVRNSQIQSSARNAGPVLHLRPSNNYRQEKCIEYDKNSPLIKKYSEYYKHLISPTNQIYTTQTLEPRPNDNELFDEDKNLSFEKKDQLKVKDFCGLTETQEINPNDLNLFSNIKRVPSALENDIDSLCFPFGKFSQNSTDSRFTKQKGN